MLWLPTPAEMTRVRCFDQCFSPVDQKSFAPFEPKLIFLTIQVTEILNIWLKTVHLKIGPQRKPQQGKPLTNMTKKIIYISQEKDILLTDLV